MAEPAQIDQLEDALLSMDRSGARRIFLQGVQGDGPVPFMENQVAAVLDRIGDAWEAGTVALSQVYMAGRICEELTLSVLPVGDPARTDSPRIALAIFEDEHMLGKRMVLAVLRNEGYDVADWGKLDLEATLTRLERDPVDILLLSCLMLSSALRIGMLTSEIKRREMAVKVVVGGAPFRFDPHLWQEVGAYAMGSTASAAGTIVRRIAGGHS